MQRKSLEPVFWYIPGFFLHLKGSESYVVISGKNTVSSSCRLWTEHFFGWSEHFPAKAVEKNGGEARYRILFGRTFRLPV
jgi:hypothetical protein